MKTANLNLIQMAHDFRSPLMAIQAALDAEQNLCPNLRELLTKTTERIRTMANELVGATPRRAALGDLEVSIHELIIEKQRAYMGVEISLSSDASLKNLKVSTLSLSKNQIIRHLSNVIDNAAEAARKPGGRVKVHIQKEGTRKIALMVCDNGKGIPPEVLPRLGEFRRSFDKKDGNGLGLHFAKTALEGVGGKIEILSKVKCGTTVVMTVPVV